MEEKSPELKKLIFPARKQRPAEARFMVWKNKFYAVDGIGTVEQITERLTSVIDNL